MRLDDPELVAREYKEITRAAKRRGRPVFNLITSGRLWLIGDRMRLAQTEAARNRYSPVCVHHR